jgi:hypothetical protein
MKSVNDLYIKKEALFMSFIAHSLTSTDKTL